MSEILAAAEDAETVMMNGRERGRRERGKRYVPAACAAMSPGCLSSTSLEMMKQR
jgi:hypothetical protein